MIYKATQITIAIMAMVAVGGMFVSAVSPALAGSDTDATAPEEVVRVLGNEQAEVDQVSGAQLDDVVADPTTTRLVGESEAGEWFVAEGETSGKDGLICLLHISAIEGDSGTACGTVEGIDQQGMVLAMSQTEGGLYAVLVPPDIAAVETDGGNKMEQVGPQLFVHVLKDGQRTVSATAVGADRTIEID